MCDARGTIVRQNDGFAAWAGSAPGDKVDIHLGRGLFAPERGPARALVVVPLTGGGWLALGAPAETPGVASGVSRVVARRLERVERSLEANAAMGLLEAPAGPVAACLRDTLASAQELRALRAQIESLGSDAPAAGGPSCLRTLVREIVETLPPRTVAVTESGADWTVGADRARLFSHLLPLIGALASGGGLVVAVRGGDPVRLHLTPPAGVVLAAPVERAVEDARRYLAVHAGRVLVDEGSLVLELPAWARSADVTGGATGGVVLVAEDDDATLAMMGAVLRRAGFSVLTADNGVAASALLRTHGAEIVAMVVDAVLPGRSGVELAAEARQFDPGIPVLLVSGHPSDLLGAADVPGLPLLTKPFGARALAERVTRLIATRD
ncbi:MAG: response regulator transcription factor [Myxococcota bacterium]